MSWSHTVFWLRLGALALVLAGGVCPAWDANGSAAAQDRSAAPALSADLALVPPDALGFVHVNVATLWHSETMKQLRQGLAKDLGAAQQQLQKLLGLRVEDLERATAFLLSPKDEGPLIALTTVKPLAREKLLATLLPEAEEHQYKGKTYYSTKQGTRLAVHFAGERTLLLGQVEDVVQLLRRAGRAPGTGPLTPALQAAAIQHHVAAGVVVPDEFVREVERNLQNDLRDRPLERAVLETLRPLLETQVVAATADLGAKMSLRLQLRFQNDKAAREALWPARDLVTVGRLLLRGMTSQLATESQAAHLLPFLRAVEVALREPALEVKGASLHAAVSLQTDGATVATTTMALLEATIRIRKQAEYAQSTNNLKQIALAMHNYHDTYGRFPPHAVYGKDGKPLLSWRVAILPYLEQEALYKRFRLDEPWDSPNNKPLLEQMPPLYAPLGKKPNAPGLTAYQGFVGKSALFEGKQGPRLADITDGTSNTLLVVEAGDLVPWTKPADLAYDPKQPLPKLGGLHPEGFHGALCDGSVRLFRKGIDELTLRALITRSGGEVIDYSKLK